MRTVRVLACCLAAVSMASVFNARATQPYEDYSKHVEAAQNLTALNDGLMGDSVSLYNGATEFAATDISVPGNNALPVQLSRRFSIALKTGVVDSNYGGIGNWDIDVPYVNATWAGQSAWPSARCSVPSYPTVPAPLALSDVWHGYSVHLPGSGDRKLLTIPSATNFPKPTAGTFYWTSAQRDMVSCITMSAQSAISGQGFLLQTTDGLKYYFDTATTRGLDPIQYESNGLTTSAGRTQYYVLASKIEDRFGNTVNFTYNANGYPTSITSSDGRAIKLFYNGTRLDHASVNVGTTTTVRTWYYDYGTSGDNLNMLTAVTLPDGHVWQYSQIGTLVQNNDMWDGSTGANCGLHPPANGQTFSYTVTHPSGATGSFSFINKRHPRSGIHINMCASLGGGQYKLMMPNYFDVESLISKTLSGPGLASQQWTYIYPLTPASLWGTRGANQPYPCADTTACPSEKVVTVNEPDGTKTDYTYGYLYASNEGRLLKTTTYDQNAVVKRVETTTYLSEDDAANQSFFTWYGYGLGDDEPSARAVRPVTSRTIVQDGVTFSWSVPTGCTTSAKYCFDAYGNPTKVVRSNTLGYSRTEQISYVADTDPLVKTYWLLGLVTQTKCIAPTAALPVGCGALGTVMSETTYLPQYGLPVTTTSFGKPQQTLGYTLTNGSQDGTLNTVTNGNAFVTTLSSWKRGVPQLITYPATVDQMTPATMSALVDDNGWITSVVDENGYATGYGYDDMGRLAAIAYPTGDSTVWNPTTIVYQSMATAEYGIPAGHWKRTESTGNSRKITYYDGMWRPLVEEQYDSTSATTISNTRSVTVKRYDLAGHVGFQSYPVSSLTSYASTSLKGADTYYDALDRVTRVDQDAEDSSVLTTLTSYLPGFQTKVTNPRGFDTVASFMAFDQPSTDWPVSIQAADGRPVEQVTDIARDIFGKPTSIKRRDPGNSISETRSYTYDVFQQLCRTVEPETGATLMGYDDAGNLTWSASGLPATTACDLEGDTPTIAARKAVRAYDARNRLKSLAFPDGRGDQEWHWTPDGLPDTATAYNAASHGLPVASAYHYNKRRMLDGTGETQTEPGWYTFGVGYGYDANGHLKIHTYPSGVQIDYAPNALGQATQAGESATDVTYWPNGAIKHFVYGNGIVHDMTQNDRQLPDTSKDAYGSTKFISDGYDYDPNGNVAAISDGATGRVGRGDRTMAYDALDRLMSAASPMFGKGTTGTVAFTHDVLDNLVNLNMPATGPTHPMPARNQFYCYDMNWRLTSLRDADGCAGSALNTLTYDVQGNVASKDGLTYDFDFGNRLREVDSGATLAESYRYDAYGRRALSFAPAGNLLSFYDQAGQLMYQRDLRQGKLLNYIYLGGSLVAVADQGLWGGAVTAKRYQHTDALGTPVAVTDENRNVIERSEYEPYGLLLNRAQHDGPGFTGHVQDALTGLTYMQQRYYDPMIGRFLSVDPVTAYSNPVGAFNRYDYAGNNPYRFTDPDGRKKIESRITKDWSSLGAHSSNGLMAPNQLSKADRSPRNSQSPKSNSSSASNSCATEERDNDNSEGVEGAENVSRLLELLNAIFGGDAAPAADTAGRFGGTVASFGMAALRTQSRDGTIAFGTMHNLLACESGGGTCEYTRDLPVINSYLRESPPNLIEINSFFEQHDWTYLSIGGLLQWQKDHPGP